MSTGIPLGKLASYAFGKTLHVNVGIFMAIATYIRISILATVYMTSKMLATCRLNNSKCKNIVFVSLRFPADAALSYC